MHTTKLPLISAIAAMAENRVIGDGNSLPWHLPADLKHFKTLTSGHPILMGRKTYESIGRPLPNRTNIIMTRDVKFTAQGCTVVTTIEEAVKFAATLPTKELFIIGGAEIYQQWLPVVQRIYLTIVHHVFDGDAYFPELSGTEWQQTTGEAHSDDEDNEYPYSFLVLERIKHNVR